MDTPQDCGVLVPSLNFSFTILEGPVVVVPRPAAPAAARIAIFPEPPAPADPLGVVDDAAPPPAILVLGVMFGSTPNLIMFDLGLTEELPAVAAGGTAVVGVVVAATTAGADGVAPSERVGVEADVDEFDADPDPGTLCLPVLPVMRTRENTAE